VILEATGGLEAPVASALAAAGLRYPTDELVSAEKEGRHETSAV
jgi:hypothetical protein